MPSGKTAKTVRKLKTIGLVLVVISLSIFIATLGPVMLVEIGYRLQDTPLSPISKEIIPVDTNFGIVIPKIAANAKIIPDVDPYNSRVYQVALTKGVAHARGSDKPGKPGNMFLFSHSSVNFYEASRYNSVFYLLTKLEFGDDIQIFFEGQKYTYIVTSKRMVESTDVQYLTSFINPRETVTLMTCWPPGTTIKRLIVVAERDLK